VTLQIRATTLPTHMLNSRAQMQVTHCQCCNQKPAGRPSASSHNRKV